MEAAETAPGHVARRPEWYARQIEREDSPEVWSWCVRVNRWKISILIVPSATMIGAVLRVSFLHYPKTVANQLVGQSNTTTKDPAAHAATAGYVHPITSLSFGD